MARVGEDKLRKKVEQKKMFRVALETKVQRMFGRSIRGASEAQVFQALSQVVSDLVKEQQAYASELMRGHQGKELYYLSMEFLMGRALTNNMINLGIEDLVEEVCTELGLELTELQEM